MAPTDDESLPALNEALAQATDVRERAGLHDAIAIRLAGDGRLEEALAANARAVALREDLAERDATVLPFLAASLSNQGGHLTALGLYDRAIVSHLRAVEILSELDGAEVSSRVRWANNACRLGVILAEVKQQALAARFDGLALALYLSLAAEDRSYRAQAQRQLNALCLSLDRADDPAPALPAAIDRRRVEAAAKPSLRTARYLSEWAEEAFEQQDLTLATVLARRAVAYCALFDEAGGSAPLASLRSQNARKATEWLRTHGYDRPRSSASGERDRRLWSISGLQLSALVGELSQRGFPSSDVHTLGRRFVGQGLYPARDCAYRCLPRPPQVFITYTWSDNYVDLQVAVRSALSYLGGLIRDARPDLDGLVVDQLVHEQLGVWIDFVFIDQTARRLVEEVREVLPRALASADVHFVLSDTAMLRSWCCYEVALFNQPAPDEATSQTGLRSFVGRSPSLNYQTFGQTEASQPDDKHTIEQTIVDRFPGGLSAFDALMIQASLLSDSFVSRGFMQSNRAIETVRRAIDRWLAL